jgi:N-acyl-D-aspartate/D-glutamate deacylase
MNEPWDTLIRDATVFDGHGGPPTRGDIAIRDGKIAARGTSLDATRAKTVVDAKGQWAMPGLVDIHTHYDLELELAPDLRESVRHGVTTVVMSNCSLGIAFGSQRSKGDGVDPIVDCFARVENIPKHVLRRAADVAVWSDAKGYLEHLDTLNLGPNVVPMIPHSMLRIQTMGFDASIQRHPDAAELESMKSVLRDALEQGYAGFSTDALPFHYLASAPNLQKKIPTQYAPFREIKALTQVTRELDRVWQATPPKDHPLQVIRTLLLTSGRLFGRPLRTTVVAALDVITNRMLVRLALVLTAVLNSRILRGRFALQSLPARFKTWSDGPITPLAEEIPELRQLNEPDLEDRAARRRILEDPDFVRRFRAMWNAGKRGFGLSRLRRALRLEDYAFARRLEDMVIERCPVEAWNGRSLAEVYRRALQRDGLGDAEREVLRDLPEDADEAAFLMHLFKVLDTDLCWHTVTANPDAAFTRRLLMHPKMLPGFSDAGAHLTNMAFYDCSLRALRLAQSGGETDVGFVVKQLTRAPAEFFNLDAGTLDEGATADVVLIDPGALAGYEGEDHVKRIYRDAFEHHQLVNRSDGVVRAVFIGGKLAWHGDGFTDDFGQRPYGRRLAPRKAAA